MKKIIFGFCLVIAFASIIVWLNRPKNVPQITTASLQHKNIIATVKSKGRIQSNEEYNIIAKTEMNILSVPVKEGQWVQPGKYLVIMDDAFALQKLMEASQNIKLRQIELTKAKEMWDTKKILVQAQTISITELKEAQNQVLWAETQLAIANIQEKSARLAYENLKIIAPANAQVAVINVKPGAMVASGTQLMQLINPNQLKVEVSVNEFDAAHIKVGQRVLITLPTQENLKIKAQVSQIQPILEKIGESYVSKVTILLPPCLTALKPGNQVDVSIITGEVIQALSLPLNAVNFENGQYSIKVYTPTGIENRIIQVGLQDAANIEVKKGLSLSEKVVMP